MDEIASDSTWTSEQVQRITSVLKTRLSQRHDRGILSAGVDASRAGDPLWPFTASPHVRKRDLAMGRRAGTAREVEDANAPSPNVTVRDDRLETAVRERAAKGDERVPAMRRSWRTRRARRDVRIGASDTVRLGAWGCVIEVLLVWPACSDELTVAT
jgi:hypothetical protein